MTAKQALPELGVAGPLSAVSPAAAAGHQLLRLATVVTLVSGCLVAAALAYLRLQAIDSGERLTRSFAQVIEEQTTRTFQSVNQSLEVGAERLAQMRSAGTLNEISARVLLRQALLSMPFARILWVTDAQGRLIFDSQEGNLGTDLSQTNYFKQLQAHPDTEFLVSAPVKSRLDGLWLIPAAKPLLATDGSFMGTIAAAVDPHYFDSLWKSIDLGSGGAITLVRNDGVVMMRSPFEAAIMGKLPTKKPRLMELLPNNPTGSFDSISPIDGVHRMFAYRTLSAQPEFVAVVGQSYDLMLQPWRRLALLAGTIWLIAASSSWVFCLVLHRAWKQKAAAETQTERLAQRLQLATDAADIGVWDWDVTRADQWFASPTYFTMLGYDPEEGFANRGQWIARLHPEDRAGVEARIQAVLAGDSVPYQYEARMLHADGRYRWVSVVGRVLARDATGSASRLMGVRLDITERKLSEEQVRQSEENLAITLQSIGDAVVATDANGHITRMNPAAERLTGWSLKEALGHPLNQVFHIINSQTRELSVNPVQMVMERGDVVGLANHTALLSRDGAEYQIFDSAAPIRDRSGAIVGVVLVFSDVTEQYRMRESVQESALHTQTILDNVVDGIITIDKNGLVQSFNMAASALFAYTPEEIIGRNASVLIEDPDQHYEEDYLRHQFSPSRAGIASISREVMGRRKDSSLFPVHLSLSKISRKGQTTLIGIVRDITQQRQDEREIRRLAFYDSLTGLPNRRLLLDRLKQAMVTSARTGKHGALMFLDLDHFKLLNDTQGHDVGDLLLQQVAQRLQTCVRDGDSVARLGGDEFVVLLEALSDDRYAAATQAETITSKLLAACATEYNLNSYLHQGTTSIGIVVFRGEEDTMDDLLKKADLAMYQGKSAGRNAARFFDPAMQAAVAAHEAAEKDLRRALAAQEFVLHYQIQVNGQGQVTGAEALVRWQHSHKGLVTPIHFIGLAERTGLILPLGQWVLETACQQLATWATEAATAHWTLAVNVSALQFSQASFVASVSRAVAQSGAHARLLKLELTESILIHDVEDVITKITALKAQGVGLSLDDFGTGYSSLSYLKRLPLDQLKIDQSFVRDVLTDPSDAVIARTILALGHSLGLTVIAEGVETEGQHQFLADAGCDAFQGYYFGRPGPVELLG